MYIFKQDLTQIVLIITLLLSFLFFVFLNNPNTAQAQLVPFGGKITAVVPCPCSASYMVYVGPPVSATVMYVPSMTKLYPFYQISRPGPWVLGIYYPGTTYTCLVYSITGCTSVGSAPIINIVGTSY